MFLYEQKEDKNVCNVSTEDIEAYAYYERKGLRLSPSTITTDIRDVNAFYNFMLFKEYVSTNPILNITSIVKTPKRKLHTNILTKEQIDKAKNISDDNLKLYIMFSLSSGAKIEDIRNLRWSNINFEKRIVSMEDKTLYFSQEVSDMLQRESKSRIENNIEDYGYVFRNFQNGRCTSKNRPVAMTTISRWCTEIGTYIGVKNLRHLDFRHSAIRLFLSASGSVGMTSIILNYPFLTAQAKYFCDSENNNELIAKYKDICEL